MFRAHFLPFCVSSKSSIVDFDHVCRSASFFRRRALSKHTKQPYTENGSPFRLCFPHCMFVHFVVFKHTFLEFPWHKIIPFHKCEKNTVIVRNILILDARNEIQHLAKKCSQNGKYWRGRPTMTLYLTSVYLIHAETTMSAMYAYESPFQLPWWGCG